MRAVLLTIENHSKTCCCCFYFIYFSICIPFLGMLRTPKESWEASLWPMAMVATIPTRWPPAWTRTRTWPWPKPPPWKTMMTTPAPPMIPGDHPLHLHLHHQAAPPHQLGGSGARLGCWMISFSYQKSQFWQFCGFSYHMLFFITKLVGLASRFQDALSNSFLAIPILILTSSLPCWLFHVCCFMLERCHQEG